jgi:hypothetical protein
VISWVFLQPVSQSVSQSTPALRDQRAHKVRAHTRHRTGSQLPNQRRQAAAMQRAASSARPTHGSQRAKGWRSQYVLHVREKQPVQWSRVGVSLVRGDRRCLPPRSPHKSCLGRRPKPNAAKNREVDTPHDPPQLGRCRPLLPTSSGHGDIKDASNGASGGGCARPRALVAVQPRLHHGRLAVRHLAQRQHGATLWLVLEAARSCPRVHGCRTQVLVAADYVELGPRLNRSNLEYVILQGSQLYRS